MQINRCSVRKPYMIAPRAVITLYRMPVSTQLLSIHIARVLFFFSVLPNNTRQFCKSVHSLNNIEVSLMNHILPSYFVHFHLLSSPKTDIQCIALIIGQFFLLAMIFEVSGFDIKCSPLSFGQAFQSSHYHILTRFVKTN